MIGEEVPRPLANIYVKEMYALDMKSTISVSDVLETLLEISATNADATVVARCLDIAITDVPVLVEVDDEQRSGMDVDTGRDAKE